jgi:hypothetical protein
MIESADKALLEDLQKRMSAALEHPADLIRVQSSTLWPPEPSAADHVAGADQEPRTQEASDAGPEA